MKKKLIEYDELLEIIKCMYENDMGENELFYFFLRACEKEKFEICQLCLDEGANIDIRGTIYGTTLFLTLAKTKKLTPKIADWLIEHGADINSRYVYSALSFACYYGNYEMAKYLIDKGAKINQWKDNQKESDLCYAIDGKNYHIVKMLLDLGVDMEIENYPTVNPFISAVNKKLYDIVELFLQRGANPDVYSFNYTPLHLAALSNDVRLAEMLLEYKANVNAIIKKDGRIINNDFVITPMDIALIRENTDMQNLLLKYSGRASTKEEKIQSLMEYKNNNDKIVSTMKKILSK